VSDLVVDASFAVRACGVEKGFSVLGRAKLKAPALMWSEARSVIRETVWRGEVELEDGQLTYRRLATGPVERTEHPDLHEETWRVAEEMGWARTYDAEYVALARLLGCRLVTLDRRLRRGADRLGFVIAPNELG
jgi:predicted nucleic acid-binding protein